MALQRHTTSIGATNVSIQALSAVTGVFIARALGTEARGELAIVLLWPGILAQLGLMGVHISMARQSAAEPGHRAFLHVVGRKVAMRLGVLVMVGMLMVPPWLLPNEKNHLRTAMAIATLAIPWSIWNVVQFHVELGAHRFKNYNLARFLFTPIYLVSTLFLWTAFGPVVEAFAAAFAIAAGLTSVVAHRLISEGTGSGNSEPRSVQLFGMVRTAFPYGLAVAVYTLSSRFDLIWGSLTLGESAIGIYVVALSLATLHASVGSAIGTVLFAHAAREGGSAAASGFMRRQFAQAVILYVLIAIAMVMILPPVVPLLYGAAYSEAARLLPVLIGATSIMAIGCLLDEGLKGKGKPWAGITARILGMAVFAGLALLMIPSIGVMALPLALLGAAVMELFVLIVQQKKHFDRSYSDFLTIKWGDIEDIVKRLRTYTFELENQLRRRKG